MTEYFEQAKQAPTTTVDLGQAIHNLHAAVSFDVRLILFIMVAMFLATAWTFYGTQDRRG